MKYGILFRKHSVWIGVHYSPANKRFCINLIPFVTLWITKSGGRAPNRGIEFARMLENKIRKHNQFEEGYKNG